MSDTTGRARQLVSTGIGTIAFEPATAALRRLALEHASYQRFRAGS